METRTRNDLRGWTRDELIDEVLRLCAEDGPALKVLEGRVLGARLAEFDRESA